eukprot:gnl/TRDRNA2_/TRDRNA2_195749_c0_seq1.p1 gnl/TRDRNA2_/TRDRNA2_195749_c0~~gnl/TRDRNA2_/TRDRNA2_195749_c0_seq1.p1  ORF type:complete len:269 (-),score=39.28 gnl/TRDRNA2_/TRDRNA2_195749_c0_seq1:98-904(-)
MPANGKGGFFNLDDDLEDPKLATDGRGNLYRTFEDKEEHLDKRLNAYMPNSARLGFIRKVYGILCVQIILTIFLALPFHMVPEVKEFCIVNHWLVWVVFALNLLFLGILSCFPHVAHTVPINYFLLLGFTVTQALLVGVITAQYRTEMILLAMGITCAIVLILTVYAFWTKADFTGWGIYGIVAALALLLVGVMAVVFEATWLIFIWLCGGVLLYCFFIVYDTQLITSGKHQQYGFTEDDYILGSLCLYTDIMNLFIYLLSLLDMSDN